MRAIRKFSLTLAAVAILTSVALALASVGSILPEQRSSSAALVKSVTSTTNSVQGAPPLKYRAPIGPQELVGGFWRIDHNFNPRVEVSNLLQHVAIVATPILYMADGTEYDLRPITIDAAGVAVIDIKPALDAAPAEIAAHLSQYGSAALKYEWHWAGALNAVVRNIDVRRSLIFSFEMRSPMNMSPEMTVREGLWWKHDPHDTGFAVLTNTSSTPVQATAELHSSEGVLVGAEDFVLSPHQTENLDLSSLDRGAFSGRAGTVLLRYFGADTDIVVGGGLENAREGYSAHIPFGRPSPKPGTAAAPSATPIHSQHGDHDRCC